MRLSELSTDRGLDVLCELTPYANSITSDPEIVRAIGKVAKRDTKLNKYGIFVLVMDRIFEFIPLLLKTHRNDVYGILSVLNERSAKEIAAQPIKDTMRQMQEVFHDEELMDFFRSFVRQGQSEQSAPSAHSPDSE